MKSKKFRRLFGKSSALKAVKKRVRRARPAHKKLLLHPLSTVAILVVGTVLVVSTIKAGAISYTVTAVVPGAIPTVPAVITSPSDGDSFDNPYINVSGTCPDNSYVELDQNSLLVGVYICQSDEFSFSVDLTQGSNQLSAQDYNDVNDAGPSSSPITVTYQPPSNNGGSSSQSQPSETQFANPSGSNKSAPSVAVEPAKVPPLRMSFSSYKYQVFTLNQSVNFNLNLSGGQAPFALTILWGDSDVSTLVSKSTGTLNISHIYSAVSKNPDYTIKVEATDSNGVTAIVQLLAVIKAKLPTVALTSYRQSIPTKIAASIKHWQWVVLPAYSGVVLTAVSFWFGERQEVRRLVMSKRRPIKTIYRKA